MHKGAQTSQQTHTHTHTLTQRQASKHRNKHTRRRRRRNTQQRSVGVQKRVLPRLDKSGFAGFRPTLRIGLDSAVVMAAFPPQDVCLRVAPLSGAQSAPPIPLGAIGACNEQPPRRHISTGCNISTQARCLEPERPCQRHGTCNVHVGRVFKPLETGSCCAHQKEMPCSALSASTYIVPLDGSVWHTGTPESWAPSLVHLNPWRLH